MRQWVWALFHGPARQRRFLVTTRSVMELAKAGLANAQLPRQGNLGRDDLIDRLQKQIDKIDKIID